jgi:aspartyl-tRNA(Asn)/glutamyl-tRNA(Gln) amidotransferase subunit A
LSKLRLSIDQIRSEFKNGNLKPSALLNEAWQIIDQKNPELNAIIRTNKESANKDALHYDELYAKNKCESLPLAGIPIIIKDNIALKGSEVTGGSKILKNFISPYDATVIKKLKIAGAIIIAQSNMDEFAMGSSNENSAYGPCKNPWDTTCVPGGSSGGSAAAVAAGFAPIALGSDTGGSIRQPAAFCGVVGLKPTYGRVSRSGLFAYASSLDQIGPLTNNVDDAEAILNVIQGKDKYDSTTTEVKESDTKPPELKELRIGLPKEFFDTKKGLDPKNAEKLQLMINKLKDAGATIKEISLPILDYVIPTYYVIANCEASSNLSRYDSIRYGHRTESAPDLLTSYKKSRQEGFGVEVKNRIMLGTFALSAGYYDAYYKKAELIRADMRAMMKSIFEDVDIILGPTSPNTAFKIGEKTEDPLSMYMQDIYTTFVNLVSNPALSVPCDKLNDMPVGIQLIADHNREDILFSVARTIESLRDWKGLND